VVLGRGRLLAHGRIEELKQRHDQQFELRVKGDQRSFADQLGGRGIEATPIDDHLLVDIPLGNSAKVLWEVAVAAGEQVRSFRPKRSTLEEIFLAALAEEN
jgi:ABC-2 type transport system ATP-binding protein